MKKRMKFFGTGAVVLIILLVAIPTNADPSLMDAVEFAVQELLPDEGFVGISYEEENAIVIVYIENEAYVGTVPEEIMDFSTEIKIIGNITAPPPGELGEGGKRKSRVRPLVGGISCSAAPAWAYGTGTLGIVTETYLLSNTHIMAMNRFGGFLLKGTDVLQPGTLDGGTPDDKAGWLYKYIRIRYGLIGLIFPNYADAAIAELSGTAVTDRVLGPDDESTYYVDIDHPITVNKGNSVRKSGRTTGVTINDVLDSHAFIKIWYKFPIRRAFFDDQIFVDQPFSSGGDSGSVVDKNGRFVGLVFAGSTDVSVVCKAQHIKDALGI